MADRLDPEHANVCLIEVNSMGQVAKIITGLKNVLDAKQRELDTSKNDLATVKADAVVAINTAEADKQTLQAQVSTLNASLAAVTKELSDAHVLDAQDEQAITDALPLVEGLDVATVVIN